MALLIHFLFVVSLPFFFLFSSSLIIKAVNLRYREFDQRSSEFLRTSQPFEFYIADLDHSKFPPRLDHGARGHKYAPVALCLMIARLPPEVGKDWTERCALR